MHSKRSLTALVARTQREEDAHVAASLEAMAAGGGGGGYDGPRIVVHDDLKEGLETKKGLLSSLPYQHRHPAV